MSQGSSMGTAEPARFPGAQLGGWILERILGIGPVGESWLASRGAVTAVVRFLASTWAEDDALRTDWLRANWAANRFHHGRVVKVLEQGTDEQGVPFVLRGYVKGETLEQLATRGALEPPLALKLLEQVLDALEMAHAHGILHAALSPTNIIVTARGSIRLVDFAATPGLLRDSRSETRDLLVRARTGPYCPPDRIAQPQATPTEQGDIWSLGTTFRFALGAAPLPEDLAAVLALATLPSPSERYESAYAMLGDVRRLLAGRRPKLRGALGPIPSQSFARNPGMAPPSPGTPPPSSSGMRWLSAITPPSPIRGEWTGNLLLLVAIALLVAAATFVLVRERQAEAVGFREGATASEVAGLRPA
jgi:serine/threonine protein kinase